MSIGTGVLVIERAKGVHLKGVQAFVIGRAKGVHPKGGVHQNGRPLEGTVVVIVQQVGIQQSVQRKGVQQEGVQRKGVQRKGVVMLLRV